MQNETATFSDQTIIAITDIPGEGTYLAYKGVALEYHQEESGYVVARAPRTPEVMNLLSEFHANPHVKLLDFLTVQRRERGKMLDLRNGRRFS